MRLTSVFSVVFIITIFSFFDLYSQSLCQVANEKGVLLGVALSDSLLKNPDFDEGRPNTIAKENFNAYVTENALKMEKLIPERPSDPFDIKVTEINVEVLRKFKKFNNGKGYRRGHALIWYSQAPKWLQEAAKNWSIAQINQFTKSYITTVGRFCEQENIIDEWDVANEFFVDDCHGKGYRKRALNGGEENPYVWYINLCKNESRDTFLPDSQADQNIYQYLKNCFKWAKAANPSAKLLYNDYCIGSVEWEKAEFMKEVIFKMKEDGVPIDGVGFQTHLVTENFIKNKRDISADFVSQIKRMNEKGLLVHITEFDIREHNGTKFSDNKQVYKAYRNFVSRVLDEPNCNLFLVWGISDKRSWIPMAFNGAESYILWDDDYHKNGTYSSNGEYSYGAWTGIFDGLEILTSRQFLSSLEPRSAIVHQE